MRPADLSGSAAILHGAMRLAAERGWDGVSIRDIAAAAGVSSSLVVHHYGTKGNLRAAVDERVVEVFTELIDEFAAAVPANTDVGGEPMTSLTAAFEARLGGDSAVLGYVRRLLFEGGTASQTLFDTLLGAVEAMLETMQAEGLVRPSDDPRLRATLLLVNDLALILLRDQVNRAVGVDPLSHIGMRRWSRTLLAVYTDGVFSHPGT